MKCRRGGSLSHSGNPSLRDPRALALVLPENVLNGLAKISSKTIRTCGILMIFATHRVSSMSHLGTSKSASFNGHHR